MVIKRQPQIKVRKSVSGTAVIRRDGYSNQTTDWWTIRATVWERDDGRCQSTRTGSKCGKPGKEVHHIVPLSRGGVTAGHNLITLCGPCHDQRHPGHTIRRDTAKPKNPWGRKPKLPPYRP